MKKKTTVIYSGFFRVGNFQVNKNSVELFIGSGKSYSIGLPCDLDDKIIHIWKKYFTAPGLSAKYNIFLHKWTKSISYKQNIDNSITYLYLFNEESIG